MFYKTLTGCLWPVCQGLYTCFVISARRDFVVVSGDAGSGVAGLGATCVAGSRMRRTFRDPGTGEEVDVAVHELTGPGVIYHGGGDSGGGCRSSSQGIVLRLRRGKGRGTPPDGRLAASGGMEILQHSISS